MHSRWPASQKQCRSLPGSHLQSWLWRGVGTSGFLFSGAVAVAERWWARTLEKWRTTTWWVRECCLLMGRSRERGAEDTMVLPPWVWVETCRHIPRIVNSLWIPSWSLLSHGPRGRPLNNFVLWLHLLGVLGAGSCVYKHLPSQLHQGWCIHGNELPNSEKLSFSNIFSISSPLNLSYKYNLNWYLNSWRFPKASHMSYNSPLLYHNVEE